MGSGWTCRGLFLIFGTYFQKDTFAIPPVTIYMSLIARKGTKFLAASPATNEGGGKVGIPCTTHGFAAGALVNIEGTVNYNGSFVVDATSTTNKIIITATYIAETFTGSEKAHEQPGPSTLTMADLVEIDAGSGYVTGGLSIPTDNVGFPTLTADPPVRTYFRAVDTDFVAAGGPLPVTGDPARYAVLTTDEVTVADRQIIAYADLASDRVVSDTQKISVLSAQWQGVWQNT